MFKAAITGIILGTALTTTGFAGGMLDNILFANKHLHKSKTQNTVSIKPQTNTTDFSGNWIGTCTDVNGPVSVEIHQSDESISLDGQHFIFGAMTTIAYSNAADYENAQIRFTWNPTGTILTLNATITVTNNTEKNLTTILSEATFALDNDKLVEEMKAVFHENLKTIDDTYKRTCSYTKAP